MKLNHTVINGATSVKQAPKRVQAPQTAPAQRRVTQTKRRGCARCGKQ